MSEVRVSARIYRISRLMGGRGVVSGHWERAARSPGRRSGPPCRPLAPGVGPVSSAGEELLPTEPVDVPRSPPPGHERRPGRRRPRHRSRTGTGRRPGARVAAAGYRRRPAGRTGRRDRIPRAPRAGRPARDSHRWPPSPRPGSSIRTCRSDSRSAVDRGDRRSELRPTPGSRARPRRVGGRRAGARHRSTPRQANPVEESRSIGAAEPDPLGRGEPGLGARPSWMMSPCAT
jgi:hypothetical protein